MEREAPLLSRFPSLAVLSPTAPAPAGVAFFPPPSGLRPISRKA